jgi:hypothetical protein
MKFNKCFHFFWVFFTLLDPDPDRASGSGPGSRDPVEYGSNTDQYTDPDQDPQHCLKAYALCILILIGLT